MSESISQFLRFCLVGTLGFIVDAATLHLAVDAFGANPYLGRVISYLVAATATWQLNRRYTFKSVLRSGAHRQWVQYVSVNAIGGVINYLVYVLCLWHVEIVRQYLFAGRRSRVCRRTGIQLLRQQVVGLPGLSATNMIHTRSSSLDSSLTGRRVRSDDRGGGRPGFATTLRN